MFRKDDMFKPFATMLGRSGAWLRKNLVPLAVAALILTVVLACIGPTGPTETPQPTATPVALGLVAEGDALLEQSDYAGALEAYDEALEADADSALAHAHRGYVLTLLQDHEAAIAACERAVEIDTGGDGLAYLAIAQASAGDAYAALETADQAVDADDERWLAHTALARAGLARGVLSETLSSAEMAVSLAPGSAHAHAVLGDVLRRMNRWDEAKTAYERAMELEPGFGLWVLRLASWHAARGDREQALALAEEAAELAPQECRAIVRTSEYGRDYGWWTVGVAEAEDAYADLFAALQINPLCQSAYSPLEDLLWNHEPPPDLEALLAEAADQYPTNVRLQFTWAAFNGLTGHVEEEDAIWEALLEQLPESYDVHKAYAWYYLGMQQFWWWDWHGSSPPNFSNETLAITHAQRALSLDPDNVEGHLYLARLLHSVNQKRAAHDLLLAARDLDPFRVETYVQLGEFYRLEGQRELHVASLKQAVALAPWDAGARRALCEAYNALGHLDKAIEQCEEAIALRPWDIGGYTALAGVYAARGYDQEMEAVMEEAQSNCEGHGVLGSLGNFYTWTLRDYGRAAEYYEQALALQPEDASLHDSLGDVYLNQGRYDDAVLAYQEAISLTGAARYHIYLAQAYADQVEPEKAEAEFLTALEKGQTSMGYWIHSELGWHYSGQQQDEKALEHFQKAYASWPEPWRLRYIANVLVRLEREDEAIALYEQEIERYPEDVSLLVGLGDFYRSLEQDEKAVAQYEAAIALDPYRESAYNSLAGLYAGDEKFTRAHRVMQDMVDADPDNLEAVFRAGVFFFDWGMTDEAIDMLAQTTAARPTCARYWGKLADTYHKAEQYEDAVDANLRAIELVPQFAWYHTSLSYSYTLLGELDKAQGEAELAYELDRSDMNPLLRLASWYVSLERFEAAVGVYEQVLESRPEDAELWYQIAVLHVDNDAPSDAIEPLETAIELAPDVARYWAKLGGVYEGLGKHQDAIESYSKAVELDPYVADYHSRLAWNYRMSGLESDAVQHSQLAAELEPDKPWRWWDLGVVLFFNQQFEEAAEAFEQAVELDDEESAFHHWLGDAYLMMGDYDAARAEYERTLEIDPDHEIALERLRVLP